MLKPRSYILCTTPRSGSTLLCNLLSDTKAAGHPQSYYRRQSIPDYARKFGLEQENDTLDFHRTYLRAVHVEGSADTHCFGLRIMWESMEELLLTLHQLYPEMNSAAAQLSAAFGKTRYIQLSRKDKVAQAVSLLKARQTGLWHMGSDGKAIEQNEPQLEPAYNAALIAKYVSELNQNDTAWSAWFDSQQIAPLTITYEDLAASPQNTLKAILTYLGLSPGIASGVGIRTANLADETSKLWIARFKQEQR